MKLSVIVPAYNDAAFIGGAIERLLLQRDVELEIVVVDDGSTDGTAEVLGRFARDSRVRTFRQPQNGGVARARQRGVAEATGEWVWFVDADDDWPDSAGRILLDVAESTGADVVVADARFEFASGKPGKSVRAPEPGTVESGEAALARLLKGEITGHLWNKLFRRTLLDQIEYVPAKVQSDLPMVASALAHATNVAYNSAVVYTYRIRPSSVITSVSRRAESLALVHGAVGRAAARHPTVLASTDYRYFVGRYVHLSGMKDAVLGGYTPVERPTRIRAARGRLQLPVLVVFATRRDWRRLALAASARLNLRVYRRLLAVADR